MSGGLNSDVVHRNIDELKTRSQVDRFFSSFLEGLKVPADSYAMRATETNPVHEWRLMSYVISFVSRLGVLAITTKADSDHFKQLVDQLLEVEVMQSEVAKKRLLEAFIAAPGSYLFYHPFVEELLSHLSDPKTQDCLATIAKEGINRGVRTQHREDALASEVKSFSQTVYSGRTIKFKNTVMSDDRGIQKTGRDYTRYTYELLLGSAVKQHLIDPLIELLGQLNECFYSKNTGRGKVFGELNPLNFDSSQGVLGTLNLFNCYTGHFTITDFYRWESKGSGSSRFLPVIFKIYQDQPLPEFPLLEMQGFIDFSFHQVVLNLFQALTRPSDKAKLLNFYFNEIRGASESVDLFDGALLEAIRSTNLSANDMSILNDCIIGLSSEKQLPYQHVLQIFNAHPSLLEQGDSLHDYLVARLKSLYRGLIGLPHPDLLNVPLHALACLETTSYPSTFMSDLSKGKHYLSLQSVCEKVRDRGLVESASLSGVFEKIIAPKGLEKGDVESGEFSIADTLILWISSMPFYVNRTDITPGELDKGYVEFCEYLRADGQEIEVPEALRGGDLDENLKAKLAAELVMNLRRFGWALPSFDDLKDAARSRGKTFFAQLESLKKPLEQLALIAEQADYTKGSVRQGLGRVFNRFKSESKPPVRIQYFLTVLGLDDSAYQKDNCMQFLKETFALALKTYQSLADAEMKRPPSVSPESAAVEGAGAGAAAGAGGPVVPSIYPPVPKELDDADAAAGTPVAVVSDEEVTELEPVDESPVVESDGEESKEEPVLEVERPITPVELPPATAPSYDLSEAAQILALQAELARYKRLAVANAASVESFQAANKHLLGVNRGLRTDIKHLEQHVGAEVFSAQVQTHKLALSEISVSRLESQLAMNPESDLPIYSTVMADASLVPPVDSGIDYVYPKAKID